MLLFLMVNTLMNLTSEPSRRGGLLGCNQCFVSKFLYCFIFTESLKKRWSVLGHPVATGSIFCCQSDKCCRCSFPVANRSDYK